MKSGEVEWHENKVEKVMQKGIFYMIFGFWLVGEITLIILCYSNPYKIWILFYTSLILFAIMAFCYYILKNQMLFSYRITDEGIYFKYKSGKTKNLKWHQIKKLHEDVNGIHVWPKKHSAPIIVIVGDEDIRKEIMINYKKSKE